jgi:peptide deformylase
MLKLYLENDPVLKEQAVDWVFGVDQNPAQLEADMIDLMIQCNGRGLAANQVGITKRVFVIHLTGDISPIAMFNPTVINQSSAEKLGEEGCLSFPGLFINVERFENITVKYLDKDNKTCTITLTGMDAKCVQHEIDHLDGICFISRVSKLKLDLARKRQRKYNGRAK